MADIQSEVTKLVDKARTAQEIVSMYTQQEIDNVASGSSENPIIVPESIYPQMSRCSVRISVRLERICRWTWMNLR